MMGRVLSFDLDGVVADTDSSVLSLLHKADDAEAPGANEDLLKYYARRRVSLDPLSLMTPDDRFIIVSGRVPMAHKLTRQWVARLFPECAGVFLVSDDYVEDLFRKGNYEHAFTELAARKLAVLQNEGVAVHFDNNPGIVEYIRSAGKLAVLVGGGLL